MTSFSFIHASDLHLGSPIISLNRDNPELVHDLRTATFKAFENIIKLCLDKRVDFLVIAGDVYDGADRNLKAQIKFKEGLTTLHDAGIHSFIVHGNHDPLDGWSLNLEWPSSVHIFSDRIETIPIKKKGEVLAVIQGISYPKKNEKRNLSNLYKGDITVFNIGLLHANIGSNTGHEPYAPCTVEDLKKGEMDYWALGHVHNRKIISSDLPFIAYPGNSQGRNIRETGEKGCYLVKVSGDKEIATEFYATDVLRWVAKKIPMDELHNEQDIIDSLNRACLEISKDGSGRPSIVRFTLTGNSPLYNFLRKPNTVSDLMDIVEETSSSTSPAVWIEKINLGIGPALDYSHRIKNQDFLGELLRYTEELLEGEDFELLTKKELSSLFDNTRAHRFLDTPNPEKLKQLLRDAERICVNSLYGDEDI